MHLSVAFLLLEEKLCIFFISKVLWSVTFIILFYIFVFFLLHFLFSCFKIGCFFFLKSLSQICDFFQLFFFFSLLLFTELLRLVGCIFNFYIPVFVSLLNLSDLTFITTHKLKLFPNDQDSSVIKLTPLTSILSPRLIYTCWSYPLFFNAIIGICIMEHFAMPSFLIFHHLLSFWSYLFLSLIQSTNMYLFNENNGRNKIMSELVSYL